jgi:hypothetical protein
VFHLDKKYKVVYTKNTVKVYPHSQNTSSFERKIMVIPVIGTSVSAAQLKDFFRQIEEGSITGAIVKAVLEGRNPFEKIAATQAVQKLLQPIGEVVFVLDPKVDYKKILKLGQNKGFWIDPDIQKFFDLIESGDVPPESVTLNESKILSNGIERTDKNITDELGAGYKLSPITALPIIATELQKVLAGGSSELFNTSAWGLMYVEDLVVNFGWSSVHGGWAVSVWCRGGDRWFAGDSVFSATGTQKI